MWNPNPIAFRGFPGHIKLTCICKIVDGEYLRKVQIDPHVAAANTKETMVNIVNKMLAVK